MSSLMPARPRDAGLTLVELLVAMATLAVLIALAAPNLRPVLERWHVRHTINGLRDTLHVARSEAIRRNGRVTVQKHPNSESCASPANNQEWDCGWFVCHDANENGVCETHEAVLHTLRVTPGSKVVRTGGAASIRFNRWGMVAGTWPSFSVYPHGKTNSDPAAQRLCMGSGGRIRVIAAATCS